MKLIVVYKKASKLLLKACWLVSETTVRRTAFKLEYTFWKENKSSNLKQDKYCGLEKPWDKNKSNFSAMFSTHLELQRAGFPLQSDAII